jgi:hypothetical protein
VVNLAQNSQTVVLARTLQEFGGVSSAVDRDIVRHVRAELDTRALSETRHLWEGNIALQQSPFKLSDFRRYFLLVVSTLEVGVAPVAALQRPSFTSLRKIKQIKQNNTLPPLLCTIVS